jgi:hypothetical protein
MKSVSFLAVLLTALALVPGAAHLLELPNKLDLSAADYLTVQSVYRGWWLLGVLFAASFLANAGMAFAVRRQTTPFLFAIGATFAVAAALVVFFVWTFPINRMTADWTRLPEAWRAMRNQWEFSHAANAGVMVVALCCSLLAALARRRE